MEEQIRACLEVLKRGGTILYPTDTVWGIGCDATNAEAVGRILALKRRDEAKGMIVLLDRPEQAVRWVREVPPVAWELWAAAEGAEPLTLILPDACGLAENLIPVGRTVAVRVVQNEFCRRVIHRLGRPLVSTSANISGVPAPAAYGEIAEAIRNGVDWAADPAMEEPTATHRASSIIRLEADGSFEIVRP